MNLLVGMFVEKTCIPLKCFLLCSPCPAALNATDAVKRIQAGLQPEESAETVDSSYVVGQVLNSRKQKQLLNKGPHFLTLQRRIVKHTSC